MKAGVWTGILTRIFIFYFFIEPRKEFVFIGPLKSMLGRKSELDKLEVTLFTSIVEI